MRWHSTLVLAGALLASGCAVQLGSGTESPTVGPATPTPTPGSNPTPTPTVLPPTPTPGRTPTAPPTPTPPPPTQGPLGSDVVAEPAGGASVRVDRYTIDATYIPPANPLLRTPLPTDTGPYATPDTLQVVPYLRYRYQASMVPVESIVVAMPGFAGGAGSFDYMARALVDAGQGAVEVWALDRRANLLEDHVGMDAAEAAGDFDVGADYYFKGAVIDDHTFAGFVEDSQVPYLSEWGLALTLHDVNAVIQQVPAPWRNQVVFLAGHSLGGSLIQHYAAMDFDGDPETLDDAGYNQIAGMVFLDGGSDPQPSQSRSDYEQSLTTVRTRDRYTSFPGLSPDVHVLLDLVGMQSTVSPTVEAPLQDLYDLDGVNTVFLRTIFGNQRFTWRGALGVAVDDNFQVAYTQQVSAGFLTGGPVVPYEINGQTFYEPPPFAEGYVVYGWDDYDVASSPVSNSTLEEVAHIDDMAYSLFLGDANFTEWYMPSRINADLGPVRNFNITGPQDYRAQVYGLNLFHNARIDVPILGFFGGAEDDSDAPLLQEYKAVIGQTLRSGAPRGAGYEMQICGGYEHLDVLFADWDNSRRPSLVLERLTGWMETFGLLGTGSGVEPDLLAPQD